MKRSSQQWTMREIAKAHAACTERLLKGYRDMFPRSQKKIVAIGVTMPELRLELYRQRKKMWILVTLVLVSQPKFDSLQDCLVAAMEISDQYKTLATCVAE